MLATLGGVGLGQQPLHRHVHEGWIGGRGGAIGESDLQHLGQQMQRLGRAEAERADIVTFQDVQHLDDMQRA